MHSSETLQVVIITYLKEEFVLFARTLQNFIEEKIPHPVQLFDLNLNFDRDVLTIYLNISRHSDINRYFNHPDHSLRHWEVTAYHFPMCTQL